MTQSGDSDDDAPRQVLRAVKELRGRGDLDAWELEITGKLLVDGRAIGDARAQLYYVWGALSREVQKVFLPYMQKAVIRPDPQAFLCYVRVTLEEPNKVWKAGLRLTKLRQSSNQAASDYLPLFEGAVFQAGGEDWPSRAKILLLISGLNAATRARLDHELWPEEYAAFTQLLRRLDSSFVTTADDSSRSRSSTVVTDDGDPMEINSVTANKRFRRCFRCRRQGHLAKDCPGVGQEKSAVNVLTVRTPSTSQRESRVRAASAYVAA